MKPHLQTTIWTLLKGGATQREIERITGISRHTIRSYQRFGADPANCPGVATDPPIQTAPPWPPTRVQIATPLASSRCEPHRACIDAQQVDCGEGAPTRVPGTERWRKPRLFVATLRYSRRSFRRVVWNSGQQIWAELHEQAWRYFGGSTRYVVLDNLKEGVLKPDL